jgi:hypothetical protein
VVVGAFPGSDAAGCAVVVGVCPGCVVRVVAPWVWISVGWAAARCGKLTTAPAADGATVPAGTVPAAAVVRDAPPGATSTTGPLCRQLLFGPS